MEIKIITAKKVAKKLGIKVVFTYHAAKRIRPCYIKKSDGIICCNNTQKEYCQSLLSNKDRTSLEVIPPFFNAEKFLNFSEKILNFTFSLSNKFNSLITEFCFSFSQKTRYII